MSKPIDLAEIVHRWGRWDRDLYTAQTDMRYVMGRVPELIEEIRRLRCEPRLPLEER